MEGESEKKKSDVKNLKDQTGDIPLPSKSENIVQNIHKIEKEAIKQESPVGKHEPSIEKPSKIFSIKQIISEDINSIRKIAETPDLKINEVHLNQKEEFTPEGFMTAWDEFTEQLKGEGNRIVSMFKAIKPELENEQTIKIHLSNAAQKDTFVQNYKQKLISFLENKFILRELDVETIVDLSESNDILYSDEQKYNYLFNKYPILKEMKKAFNLDIT
jgi:DNA polymerase-3 subunit gamma/tau